MSTMPMMMPPPAAAPAPAANYPNPLAPPPSAPMAAGGSPMSNVPDWGQRPEWAASANPDDFGKGGGLFGDQAQVECIHAEFTLNPPPNYPVAGQVFFFAQLKDLSDPTGATVHPQWWSAGKAEDVVPSADGEWLLKNPNSQKDLRVNEGTNFALLCATLRMKGYPANLMAVGSVKKIFSGPGGNLMFKTIRQVTERAGLAKQAPKKDARGNDRTDPGVIVAESIIKFPWESAPRVALAARPGVTAQPQYIPPSQPAQQQQYAPAPVAQAAPPAPTMMAPPPAATTMAPPAAFAAPPPTQAPPQQQQQAANPALQNITDQQAQATLAAGTIATLVDNTPGGLPLQQARIMVFRALSGAYAVDTINVVAAVADNAQWLTSAGFRIDAATNTIHRA